MIYLGDYPTGATVYVPFNTFSSVGASITITGLAVTDIEIYKDGSATQRASDAGYTLLDTDGIDFDSLTGLHGFSIDLSDNTDAGFYAAGHEYMVAVSSITCDSQTVSFWAATFSIDRWFNQAITRGQVKITANAANEGALDIRNSNANGIGTYNQGGDVGLYNDGTALYGQYNVGADTGLYNNGTGAGAYGNYNAGVAIGQYNAASGAASAGQTNQGVADGQYNFGTTYGQQNTGASGQVNVGTAGVGSYNSGTTYGIQASGVTSDIDPDLTPLLTGVNVSSISNGAITSASIATGAIDADALATDAADEIADHVWDDD